jgi:hypothetical protein
MKKRKVSRIRRVHKIIKKIKKVKNIPQKIKVPIISPFLHRPKKTRRKKTPSNKMYFTQDTENSIVEYNKTVDQAIRNQIYNTKIRYPFEKLVENVFNTFKFSYFEVGPLEIQKETVTHLVSNMHKFEPGKGKAFSYFSIIAKHYLIALNNSTYKRFNQHIDISEERDGHTIQLQCEDKHFKDVELNEFMNLMVKFWENNVDRIFTKQRDLDIANAVIELFRRSDRLESFNKKALYLYIRDISSCKTQQITKVINRMKQYQNNIQKTYLDKGSINTGHHIKV